MGGFGTRPLCVSPFSFPDCYLHLLSTLGPSQKKWQFFQSIRISLRYVLLHSDHHPPPIYTDAAQIFASLFPVARYMYQRRTLMQSRRWYSEEEEYHSSTSNWGAVDFLWLSEHTGVLIKKKKLSIIPNSCMFSSLELSCSWIYGMGNALVCQPILRRKWSTCTNVCGG